MMLMNRFRKGLLYSITISTFILLTLTGCWDNRDIDHRILPVALGVSKIDNVYKVVITIPDPSEGTIKSQIVSAKEKTLAKALDTISRNMESRVDLLHVKLILIERGTAEEGVKDIIAGFMRSREVSPKALVAFCDEDIGVFFSKLKDFMGTDGLSASNFFEENAGWDPEIALTRVWQVYRGIHSYTHDVAIPLIRSGDHFAIEQIGSAIVKNGKMVEQISAEETLLYNIFLGHSCSGEIEVMDNATVRIVSYSIRHNSEIKSNQPILESKIKLKVVLLETRGDPSANDIKKALNQLLTERFEKLTHKTKESMADIFGVGQFFRTKLTRKELNHWRTDYYPQLKMDIQFNVHIQNEGNLKTT